MAGIWDFLNREFSPGVTWANKAAGVGGSLVKGILDSTVDAVKVPGQMMKPNPYPSGSEEADWWDTQKYKKAIEWAPEMALNTMGTGGILGVPVKGAESVLGAGIIRPKQPLIGTYHGTGSPAEYSEFKLPPKEHDIGIHTTVNPNVATTYSYPKAEEGVTDFVSGLKFGSPEAAEARIKPVLTNVQSALQYPTDAVKWNNPHRVIAGLETWMDKGFNAPKGLLSDMYNISGSNQTWRDQFVPMLKDRGYDSIVYPHLDTTGNKAYNSFLAFDPEQVIPRFSPKGQDLARKQGVYEPVKKVHEWNEDEGKFFKMEKWRMPEGIIKKSAETESYGVPGMLRKANPNIVTDKIMDEALANFKSGEISYKEYMDIFKKYQGKTNWTE